MRRSAWTEPTVGTFEESVEALVSKYALLWANSSTLSPAAALTFTPAAQRSNERETDVLIDSLKRGLQKYPGGLRDQTAWRDRMLSILRRVGAKSFRFADSHLDIIFSPDYIEVTRDFARQARNFDPAIETAALAQALRNVWVMNFLQLMLGSRPSLSPSIFAYSLLYPYTDNYLDQPSLSQLAKQTASIHLGRRLGGGDVAPDDVRQATVFRLIEMIEGEFPREFYPQVYSSLMAIHNGQVKSLRQQRLLCDLDVGELLRISVEKGGSSVLTDGWLVAGKLGPEESDSFFAFGVLLQLLDDLQDLSDDLTAGHSTLFTLAASRKYLDGLTSRLWHFMQNVLVSSPCFADPGCLELSELLRRNCTMLILRAVAECPDSYSGSYLRHMERFSPLGFDFLRNRRKTVEQEFSKAWGALARRRHLESIFDLLG